MPGGMTQLDGTYSSSDDETDTSPNSALQQSKLEVPPSFSITVLKDLPIQVDGICDTSDDDDDDDEDDDDMDDDDDEDDNDEKEDEENDVAENGIEEVSTSRLPLEGCSSTVASANIGTQQQSG